MKNKFNVFNLEFRVCNLKFIWNLELGICNLKFIWNLVLGAWNLPFKNRKLVSIFGLLFFAWNLFLVKPALAGELANQFTIELWVKPTGSVASKAILVKNNEIRLVTNASGQPLCQIYSGGAWQTAATSSTALSLNTWSHVACSYDKSTLKVFLNGIQVGSQSLSVSVNDASTGFRAGSDEGGSYGDLNGWVDDIKIYNYARTQKQIIEDMNADHPAVGSPVGSALAYYKFDEGYGSTVNNLGLCGSACNGSLGTGSSAPSWTNDGKFGKALSFDGSNDYVGISGIDIANKSFSLSAWAKRNVKGSRLIIFGQGSTSQNQGLHVGYETGNLFTCAFYNNDLDTSQIDTSTEWTHWVCTYDIDSRSRKIYRNGKLVASDIASANYQGTGTFYIGRPPWNSTFFNGLIDEVKIYNYALTEEEIKAEYNRGAAMVLGSLSDTSGLSGGSVASNSASAEYCVPGDTSYCAPPVAEWKFDEKQGTTAYDTSGNGNTGTWNGTLGNQWKTGKVGSAGNFNGTNNYVEIATGHGLLSTDITISMWIYPTSWTHQTHTALITSRSTTTDGLMFFILNQGNLNFDWGDGSNQYRWNTGYQPPLDTWTHLTITRNSSGRYLYVNGRLQNSTGIAGGPPTANTVFRIGSNTIDTSYNFQGKIDQVRVYNYARTPAQIAWDFNRGQPVAWWKFDECQGTTAYDTSASNAESRHDGTIVIGASGSQTSAGTCTSGNSTDAWYNGRNGKYNSSLNFDGTDDYVSTSNIALIAAASQTYSDVSWGAWVKASSNQTSKTIIHKSGEFRLYTDSNGYPTCQVGDTGNTAAATFTLPNNTWSHLLCTYDGSNIKLYLNGTQIASNSRTGTITSSSSTNVNIAQKSDSSERYAGQIDDVRIYNYALTPTLVKQLYNEGAAIRFGPSEGNP